MRGETFLHSDYIYFLDLYFFLIKILKGYKQSQDSININLFSITLSFKYVIFY